MTQVKKEKLLSENLLSDLQMALQDNSYEMHWYLDLEEGDVTMYTEDYYMGDEEDWNRETREMIENDESGERFIYVEGTTSHEDWKQMEHFILSLEEIDEQTRNLLLTNIQGRGAFRRFQETMHQVGFIDEWYEYRDRNERRKTLDWLKFHDLITEEDVEKGMQEFEELLKQRRQRKEDMANMVIGRTVKCIMDDSYKKNITVGKTYQIEDERIQNKSIRIRGDQGRLVWMPKSNFELVE